MWPFFSSSISFRQKSLKIEMVAVFHAVIKIVSSLRCQRLMLGGASSLLLAPILVLLFSSFYPFTPLICPSPHSHTLYIYPFAYFFHPLSSSLFLILLFLSYFIFLFSYFPIFLFFFFPLFLLPFSHPLPSGPCSFSFPLPLFLYSSFPFSLFSPLFF